MKKISAVFAAVATLLMAVFALVPSAFADDYSATVNANPNADGTATVTVTLDDATYDAGYHFVGLTVDDVLVGNVSLAAEKTYGWWEASADTPHTVNIKLTTLNCKDANVTVLASKTVDGANAITVGSQSVSFPATCSVNGNTGTSTGTNAASGSTSGATAGTAQTGASVLPYVAAVVLLIVAGVAFLALRKKNR